MARDRPISNAASVADQLHSAAIHLLRALRLQDEASGVGPARLSALSILVFAGSKTLGELARMEQVRPPTMSRIVDGLERSGLARRKRDRADGRSVRIHATKQGTRLLQEARIRRVKDLAVRMAGLEREDLECMMRASALMERIL